MIPHANDDDFDTKVHGSAGPVLVDFTAKWCGRCVAQKRVLERFIASHPDVPVYEVDVEEAPKTSAAFGIRAMPTLLLFRDGALEHTAVGLQSEVRVRQLVEGR